MVNNVCSWPILGVCIPYKNSVTCMDQNLQVMLKFADSRTDRRTDLKNVMHSSIQSRGLKGRIENI